jgi:hypothetical protein
MAKPVDTDNGPIKAVRSAAFKYLRAQLLSAIVKAAPFLFTKATAWFFNPVLGFFADKLIDFLLEKTILGLALIWIAIDLSYEVSTAENATKKLN